MQARQQSTEKLVGNVEMVQQCVVKNQQNRTRTTTQHRFMNNDRHMNNYRHRVSAFVPRSYVKFIRSKMRACSMILHASSCACSVFTFHHLSIKHPKFWLLDVIRC